jgi:hypothetical protein
MHSITSANLEGRRATYLAAGCVLVFVLLGIYSEYWLSVVWPHPWGEDFSIYYRAYTSARAGESAYFPYGIGGSFVYHPFALTVVSLCSLFGLLGETAASVVWAVMNVTAYGAAILVALRLIDLRRGRAVFVGLLLATFAPFWETMHIGQINPLVVLSLALALAFAEEGRDLPAGVCLALAILLKTSPLIFVPYFLFVRRYRVVLISLAAVALFSLVAWLQFGTRVYADFMAVLPLLGAETHPNFFNHSIPGTVVRILTHYGVVGADAALTRAHKLVTGALTGLALLSALALPREAGRSRRWLFGLLLVLMTMTSPLVWYHHNVFLLLPLVFVLGEADGDTFLPGLGLLFLVQAERLYESLVAPLSGILAFAGLAVLVAQLALLILLAVVYVRSLLKARRGEL